MSDLPLSEVLPEPDPIVTTTGAESTDLGHLTIDQAGWDLSGLTTVILVGTLPVLADLFFRGTDGSGGSLVNLATVGYSIFAISVTAMVQCAQNEATRTWTAATTPAVVAGLILGLNYSDPKNQPDTLGYGLTAAAIVLAALSIFVGWRPSKNGR